MAEWIPLSQRENPSGDFEGPFEGVPVWLRGSLIDWVRPALTGGTPWDGYSFWSIEQIRFIERSLRLKLPTGDEEHLGQWILRLMQGNSDFLLDVVDLVLSNLAKRTNAVELRRILEEAGSIWTPVLEDHHFRLERRVQGEVMKRANRVMESRDNASKHLKEAWIRVYGRSPDPSSAYREAVRAVEAAAKTVVSPNNKLTTLGTIIADVKSRPTKFAVSLEPGTRDKDPVEGLVYMLRLLWKAQIDRHGTDDQNARLHVSLEEAETALHLAITLVHWFREGLVTAR
ncbi:MAG: hypothetical protein OXM57_09130 [bacterium]|nr:hypothetical protein [bacterium]MDE0352844.1 hypothetical protein [bacterium]